MRRLLMMFVLLAVGPATAGAADCTADVKTAFQKQRDAQKYRVAMSQPSAEGPVQMTVDYQLPDRMLQTVVSPSMPGEQRTMLVGNRAFAGSGGGYEELLPQFAQSVLAEFRAATNPDGANLGSFECLGKQSFEGKDYLAFRTADPKSDSNPLARTIYVDPGTGLPAYNVVGDLERKAEPVLKAVYSYPSDIDIETPDGAPVHTGPQ